MKKYTKIFLLFAILLVAVALSLIISEPPKTKLETLNIKNLKMVISNIDFADGSTQYGINLYVDTNEYKLDSNDYYIKPIFLEDDLNKYILGSKINIPQSVTPQRTFNVASDFFDEDGYLKECVGNVYEIKLELYKGNAKLDSEVYQVLCEAG